MPKDLHWVCSMRLSHSDVAIALALKGSHCRPVRSRARPSPAADSPPDRDYSALNLTRRRTAGGWASRRTRRTCHLTRSCQHPRVSSYAPCCVADGWRECAMNGSSLCSTMIGHGPTLWCQIVFWDSGSVTFSSEHTQENDKKCDSTSRRSGRWKKAGAAR